MRGNPIHPLPGLANGGPRRKRIVTLLEPIKDGIQRSGAHAIAVALEAFQQLGP
jgi:hypothetical protein